jgi:hypothetical protein
MESFDPCMKVTVGLSRYSSGGTTKLFFDGARSQVRSYDDSQKKAMIDQRDFNNMIPMESGEKKPVILVESSPTYAVDSEETVAI